MSTDNLHSETTNNKNKNVFVVIFHLIFATVLVLVTPWFLSLINEDQILEIRENSPIAESRKNLKTYRAKITEIINENESEDDLTGTKVLNQQMLAQLFEGPDRGKKIEVFRQVGIGNQSERFVVGDQVVVSVDSSVNKDNAQYFLDDRNRLNPIFWLIIVFFILVVIMAGARGITSFLALIFSLIFLIQFLIPQILTGANIIMITFFSSLVIGLGSLFMSHGFSKRIWVSGLAMVFSIFLSTLFSWFTVSFTRLTGLTSDEVFALQSSQTANTLNFQGLLLASVIIGSIGVLDDVIVAQATAIEEINKANPKLTRGELIIRGFRVGQEHIISMVNSLSFAYVGASLPLLMIFSLYNYSELWVTLNSEVVAEEIVRTIIGSVTLLLSVPLTTFLAAYFLNSKNNLLKDFGDLDKINPTDFDNKAGYNSTDEEILRKLKEGKIGIKDNDLQKQNKKPGVAKSLDSLRRAISQK